MPYHAILTFGQQHVGGWVFLLLSWINLHSEGRGTTWNCVYMQVIILWHLLLMIIALFCPLIYNYPVWVSHTSLLPPYTASLSRSLATDQSKPSSKNSNYTNSLGEDLISISLIRTPAPISLTSRLLSDRALSFRSFVSASKVQAAPRIRVLGLINFLPRQKKASWCVWEPQSRVIIMCWSVTMRDTFHFAHCVFN